MPRRRHPQVPLKELDQFVKVVRRLRRDCPWDREQTHQSMRSSLIEEAYEVIEALDTNNMDHLKGELGDLLLHILLHATIAEEAGTFTLKEVLKEITEKLIRRHPHVFGDTEVRNSKEVKKNWEMIKLKEGRKHILDGLPNSLPALQLAEKVQERAAKAGFDWPDITPVWEKVLEEVEEFRIAVQKKRRKKREEEFGDLLFALVNYARYIRVDPESAMRSAVAKFGRRFRFIEEELAKRGKDPYSSTLEEMDAYWNLAKKKGL